jgi:hypothetical protein
MAGTMGMVRWDSGREGSVTAREEALADADSAWSAGSVSKSGPVKRAMFS